MALINRAKRNIFNRLGDISKAQDTLIKDAVEVDRLLAVAQTALGKLRVLAPRYDALWTLRERLDALEGIQRPIQASRLAIRPYVQASSTDEVTRLAALRRLKLENMGDSTHSTPSD